MINDVDKDKDYDPDEDLEAYFVAKDQDIEDDNTFEVEKHIHAINIVEAGDYLVAMRRYMEAFERIIHRGKSDVPREYKKLIHFVKLMIDKLGAYSLNKAGDVDAVYDMIVDPQCVAWWRALHGGVPCMSQRQETVKKFYEWRKNVGSGEISRRARSHQ